MFVHTLLFNFETLLGTYLACLTTPPSSSIRVQLELPVLDLSISNLPTPVTADVEYEALCQVTGSQPPAEVTWRLGDVVLPTAEEEPRRTHDNNLTTSTLLFTPKIKDQASRGGKRIIGLVLVVEDQWITHPT